MEKEREKSQEKFRAMIQERGHLREQVRHLEGKMDELRQAVKEAKAVEKQLEQRANQLEVGGRQEVPCSVLSRSVGFGQLTCAICLFPCCVFAFRKRSSRLNAPWWK